MTDSYTPTFPLLYSKLLQYFWCLGFLSPGTRIFVLDHAALFFKNYL